LYITKFYRPDPYKFRLNRTGSKAIKSNKILTQTGYSKKTF